MSTATEYNKTRASLLWVHSALPEPLRSLDPGSAAFADAVSVLQARHQMVMDGKLGPQTLQAIGYAAPVHTTDALIATCEHEASLKVREVGGMNKGPKVEEYQRTVGLGPGDPWCAAFVAWCMMKSRQLSAPPSWCSGSAITTWHKGSRKAGPDGICTPLYPDYQKTIKPGWVWVRAKDKNGADQARRGTWVQGHIGIVVAVDTVGFHTVEGNTNAAGSRDGDGVYRKLHKWTDTIDLGRTVGWFDSHHI